MDSKFQRGDEVKRPGFTDTAYYLAKQVHAVNTGYFDPGLSLKDEDLAVIHRYPYVYLKRDVELFTTGKETEQDLERWTDRMIKATKKRKRETVLHDNSNLLSIDYEMHVDEQIDDVKIKRKRLIDKAQKGKVTLSSKEALDLLSSLNSLHGNVPDLGPHNEINNRVKDRGHLNITQSGTMSPMTETFFNMSPHRWGKGFATTNDDKHVVTTQGQAVRRSKLPKDVQDKLNKVPSSTTNLEYSDLWSL